MKKFSLCFKKFHKKWRKKKRNVKFVIEWLCRYFSLSLFFLLQSHLDFSSLPLFFTRKKKHFSMCFNFGRKREGNFYWNVCLYAAAMAMIYCKLPFKCSCSSVKATRPRHGTNKPINMKINDWGWFAVAAELAKTSHNNNFPPLQQQIHLIKFNWIKKSNLFTFNGVLNHFSSLIHSKFTISYITASAYRCK